ncbi:hypothetical protein DL96DRAFT_1809344 [Flagelloscypha sp. PMI_526]|nr:hypothetical protein DL96DRAFT_1809344 [Flagelloscypha sp. PMI_526]
MSSFSGLGIELAPTDAVSATLRQGGSQITRASASIGSMRSLQSMHALLSAETGSGMVQLNANGSLSSGHDISCLNSLVSRTCKSSSLDRHNTVLAVGASEEKNAKELKLLLGNSNAKVKAGAAISQGDLERAKSRARVELDIVLQYNTFVQGSHVNGSVKVRIRKPGKKQSPIRLSGGKLRLVGFENISGLRHTFYQHSFPLSDVSNNFQFLYESEADSDDFAQGRQGVHDIPFSFQLPLEGDVGQAKGSFNGPSSVDLRYIILVTMKIKDTETDRRSIAHFYRDCDVWPRLDPSIVLAPALSPLSAEISKSFFMGGQGQLFLKASIARLSWIAGQRCYVQIEVMNNTTKYVKRASISLFRSIVMFYPDSRLNAGAQTIDPDACRTNTIEKGVSESILDIGDNASRRHASSQGWWSGVGPSQHAIFQHFIELPTDSLSVHRSRLLEVKHELRISLNAGALMSDVSVTLPVHIVNFLSLDPPPSVLLSTVNNARAGLPSHNMNGLDPSSTAAPHTRMPIPLELTSPVPTHQPLHSLSTTSYLAQRCLSQVQEADEPRSSMARSHSNNSRGEILFSEDTDDIVRYAVSGYGGEEHAPTFADLYYQDSREQDDALNIDRTMDSITPPLSPQISKSRLNSFAARVHEKLEARQLATDQDALLNEASVSEARQTEKLVAASLGLSASSSSVLHGPSSLAGTESHLSMSSSSPIDAHSLYSEDPNKGSYDLMCGRCTPTIIQTHPFPEYTSITSVPLGYATPPGQAPNRRKSLAYKTALYEEHPSRARTATSAPSSRRNSLVSAPTKSVKDKIKDLEARLASLEGSHN